jgi:hypothetical protein
MSLFATLTFDDDDAYLHPHLTGRARDLDEHNPAELARVLRTLEAACIEYAARVTAVRLDLEARLQADELERAARS